MDPKVASELSLRIPHLALRVAEHSRRAATFAERLEAAGAAVRYPGLPSHPQHELIKSLANPGEGAAPGLPVGPATSAQGLGVQRGRRTPPAALFGGWPAVLATAPVA